MFQFSKIVKFLGLSGYWNNSKRRKLSTSNFQYFISIHSTSFLTKTIEIGRSIYERNVINQWMMFPRKINASNDHMLDQTSNSIIKKLFYLNIRNILKFEIAFENEFEILPSRYQNWFVYVTFDLQFWFLMQFMLWGWEQNWEFL